MRCLCSSFFSSLSTLGSRSPSPTVPPPISDARLRQILVPSFALRAESGLHAVRFPLSWPSHTYLHLPRSDRITAKKRCGSPCRRCSGPEASTRPSLKDERYRRLGYGHRSRSTSQLLSRRLTRLWPGQHLRKRACKLSLMETAHRASCFIVPALANLRSPTQGFRWVASGATSQSGRSRLARAAAMGSSAPEPPASRSRRPPPNRALGASRAAPVAWPRHVAKANRRPNEVNSKSNSKQKLKNSSTKATKNV